MNCTKAPVEKATSTLKKIPSMIFVAVLKLMKLANSISIPCCQLYSNPMIKPEPNSSKTIETVVDVGSPMLL